MTKARTFILDSDVFITAKNAYYAFDICPGWINKPQPGHAVLAIDVLLAGPIDESRSGRENLAHPVGCQGEVGHVGTCGHALAAPACQVRHQHLRVQVDSPRATTLDLAGTSRNSLLDAQCNTLSWIALSSGFRCPAAADDKYPSLSSHWMTPPRPLAFT